MRQLKHMVKYLFIMIKHSVLLFFAFVSVLPLLSCILVSFKSQEELVNAPFFSFVGLLNFENYKRVWENGLGMAFVLSAIIVVVSVFISCTLNAMVAYVLSRFEFKAKKLIYGLILLASFIPPMTMQVYIFRIMSSLNLVNTIFGYVLMLCGIDIVSIFIFSTYYKTSIPKTVDEAAILDGCNHRQVFFKIHIPLLRQAFITSAIIRAIVVYNEYYLANIYLLDKTKHPTVTTILYYLSSPFATDYPVICAGVVLAILPTVILFIVFQKRIYNGLSTGRHNN